MKHLFSILVASTLLFSTSSCGFWNGNATAVSAGGMIGGTTGAILGDAIGGWHGSQFGALIGTVAGAAIANAATAPKTQVTDDEYNYYQYNGGYSEQYQAPSRRNEAARNRHQQQLARDRYKNQVRPISGLQISNVSFDDYNRNGIINANETCYLIFDIENRGQAPAYNVTPVINISDSKNIKVSPAQQISYMAPGDKLRYKACIKSNKKIRNTNVVFNVFLTESSGATSDGLQFSLPSRR